MVAGTADSVAVAGERVQVVPTPNVAGKMIDGTAPTLLTAFIKLPVVASIYLYAGNTVDGLPFTVPTDDIKAAPFATDETVVVIAEGTTKTVDMTPLASVYIDNEFPDHVQ